MSATSLTAIGAAVLLIIPRAAAEPLSAAVWLCSVALAVLAARAGRTEIARAAAPVAVVLSLQVAFFPLPQGQWLFGLVLGAIASLVALGMALIYRANQVLNFAQAELGTAPAVMVVGLVTVWGWSWWVSVPLGLLAALVLGAVVELVVIRRFARAPRLILTVATIGLSQLLTGISILLPRAFGVDLLNKGLDVPWDIRIYDGPPALTGDHVLALIAVPVIIGALAAFIRFTDVGVAIRAASESSDRAALLGIPVRRLQTTVWVIATGLGFCGVLLRAGVVSLPVAATLSFGVLLTALAALVLGGLTDLVAVAAAAVAVGILEQGVMYNAADELVAPVVGGLIVVTLLVRKVGRSRADSDGSSSWRGAAEVRPIPAELRALPEIRAARVALAVIGGLGLAAFAVWASPSDLTKGSFLACFVLVVASIVVLTGWSGQVSLGQMSFVAVGAATAAALLIEWRVDVSLALVASGLAGAVVAVLIGLPALRLRGPLLGVTTLAFAVASSQFLLSRSRNRFLPRGHIERARLFAHFDLLEPQTLFVACVAVAGLGLVAVRGLRASRTGRVLIAQRDNEAAVAAFGISAAQVKLSAFAVSGALAGVAGCMYVVGLQGYSEQPFEPAVSFNVFTAAVVGGLGSIAGAIVGALFLNGGRWFLPPDWQLLPSAVGVLVVLVALPGGLGEVLYRGRDALLRKVAERRGLVVPSLVADVRVEDPVSPGGSEPPIDPAPEDPASAVRPEDGAEVDDDDA